MDLLKKIIAKTREKVTREKSQIPLTSLRKKAENKRGHENIFLKALNNNRMAIIAEIKKASPSRGVICQEFHPEHIALDYFKGGADAISVLTESTYFQGDIGYLDAISKIVTLPLLRKDFIIDEYQIYQTAATSAHAFLLIVAALEKGQLADFVALSQECGLDALVEIHSENELEIALQAGALIVGVNNRDLHTFKTDVQVSLKMGPLIPQKTISVSESGIHHPDDLVRLAAAGYRAVLIGESLMRQEDKAAGIRRLRGESCG
jgi:indole-3-glycerol phosphate synthase